VFKRNIPNAITCGNLFCGCTAIVKSFEGDLVWAAYLVGIAAVLDFLDGFAARMLHVSSPIGKDLDSLADMVTFGIVPGMVMYRLLEIVFHEQLWGAESMLHNPLTYIAFFIPIFSAIRLAKFNNDTRQSESFIGMPTPANAILICSLPLILYYGGSDAMVPYDQVDYMSKGPHSVNPFISYILNKPTLICLSILTSAILVAPIPLFSLKFKHFKWKGNEIRYVFLTWSVLLFFFLRFIGIPLVIVSYILFSVGNNLINSTKKTIS
jgi:CDP-diacylglycerol--serine O-phosphatidyltransferase